MAAPFLFGSGRSFQLGMFQFAKGGKKLAAPTIEGMTLAGLLNAIAEFTDPGVETFVDESSLQIAEHAFSFGIASLVG